ncbi:MAG: glycosyltransferase family 39 protein [Elusimicrobiota bacterium]|nr:MAG: glycosyltransferase family 39 protein [Elusimicrobiota bacterium]
MGKARESRAVVALLGSFAAWQAWDVSRFIAHETRPPAWDQANHLTVALRYLDAAAAGRWGDIWTYTPNAAIPPFPPVYHLLLAPWSMASSPAWSALWVNAGYLALLVAVIWGLARELRRDGPAAAAAVAFACAPVVQHLAREQLVDLPLTAVAAAAYWALARADGFRRLDGSLWFGAAFGLGMLHKWSFFSYVLPAFVLGLAALRRPADRRKALAAGALGLGLCLPWYLIRAPLVFIRLTQATNDFVVPFWKGGAFFSYLGGMPAELGWPFCALAAWSLWALRRDSRRSVRAVALCAAAAYVFWALLPNRQMRYLLPGLAGLPALIAAAAPGRSSGRWPRGRPPPPRSTPRRARPPRTGSSTRRSGPSRPRARRD